MFEEYGMNKKQGRSLSRRRTIVISLIVVLVIAGGFFLLGTDDKVEAPSLEYPKGVSREEQVAYIMQEHIVHQGGQPVHSFVLYAENKPEGIVIHKGVGTIGRSDTPIDQEYQYKVASSTKPVVATIILQLMEEGELGLDDPASKYLEEIAYLRFDEIHVLDGESHADEITIDHLLQHRTGFGDIFTDTAARFFIGVFLHPKRQYSPEMIMEKFFAYKLNEKPHFKPGEGYYYSDTNYVLLGLIIEQITGDSLSDQIRQRVLEPLEMHDTYFEFYEAETGSGKRLNSYQGRLNMTKYFNTSFDWGGGGLVSTTQDMATFMQALFGMELFEYESTLHLMLDNSENEADGASYARGINQYALDGDTYYEHGGHWGSLMMYNPERDVVLSAHLAQANLPYDVEDSVKAILEIIEAR